MKYYIKSSEHIFAMALPKKEVAARLDEVTRPLTQHLIKIMLWPGSRDAAHWRQEIYNFLHNVSKIKGTNKFPSANFIYKHTIGSNTDLISVWHDHIVDDYIAQHGSSRWGFDEYAIQDYFRWLAGRLSEVGEVSRREVYAAIDEYLLSE